MRRRAGVKRIGHAGTLDPAATGVLPLCMGQATRLVEYLVDATKTYAATIQLGLTTNTYDLDGEVTGEADPSDISLDDIENALGHFRGEIQQTPPMFSALKRDGVPLYKLARRGETVELPSRPVSVERLDITHWQSPTVTLELDCSKGFYVRSLAHDLGQILGAGAALAGLVRKRVGSFRIEQAVGLEELRGELEAGTWQRHLTAPDEVLIDWPAAILEAESERRIRNGQQLIIETNETVERCRAYTVDGSLLAVLHKAGGSDWQPQKVFSL